MLKMKKLNHMNEFFLNKTNIKKILNNICFINDKEKHIEKEKKEKKEKIKDNFFVKEKDKLFWFWYIFENGYDNYEMLGKNTFQTEMKLKTSLVETIHKEKRNLKSYKMKINDIEQDILYSKHISIQSFMIILALNRINLVYYTDVIYYENMIFDDKTIVIYHNKDNDIYEMKESNIIETIKNEKYIVQSLDKRIKAISNYKVSEIKEIASKLKIEIMKTTGKSFTKKELYEKIVQKLS